MPLRQLTKTKGDHFCCGGVSKPMVWRPVGVIVVVYPELRAQLKDVGSSIAAYCPACQELWVVPIKGD